jgi:ankyrin repeat protein
MLLFADIISQSLPFHKRHLTAIVQLLLERGANVNVKSDKGETPLQLAVKNGHEDAADLLRQRGTMA